jgi:ABC-type branched-subunit amino acid transport system ATPase component/ABC-type branched-subunit amino acid transport system permease subunit
MSVRAAVLTVAAFAGVCVLILRGDGYQLYVIVLVGLTAIVGIGLNVLLGLTGQISLGHVAFYAIGAYAVGILTTTLGWSFWLALPAAALFAGLAGVLLAIPALRVRGPYLAMVTIAFGFVVEQGAAEWAGLTGGWNGLIGIPAPRAFGFEFTDREIAFLVLVLTLVSLVLYARLSASPWGKAMRAVRDSETAALSIGLDPTLVRTTAFAISAIAAGIAGGVFASISNFISPESFPFFQSILFLLVVMLGGADRVLGPLIGAVIVVLLPELLSFLAGYRLLFVGLLMLVVLRLAPSGVVGLFGPLFERRKPARAPELGRDVIAYLTSGSVGRSLVVRELSVGFGGVRALADLTFEARPGEITSIIGPNGAGKTTALNLICGFYRPDAGAVRLGEHDLTGMSSHRIARAGVGRTYQTSQLFATMSVLDNVLIALRRGRLGVGTLMAPDRDPERHAVAASLLAFVGYRGALERPAGALAHVDKRLVEIARALAIRPGVLILDEPAAGLDGGDTAAIGRLLQKVAGVGINVLLIEHDMALVMGISSHVVVLDAGAKIAEGPPAAIARDPGVLRAYLGEDKPADRARRRLLPAQAATLLATHALSAGYGQATVVRDIALRVDDGEAVAVLGANGAGKSTLMRALSGLNRPVAGEVVYLGERVERLTANRIAGRGLVLVPEGRQVFAELSVLDNLRLGAFARPAGGTTEMVEQLLQRFPPLRERLHQRAGLLSGGEQQMLAIARGLMARPRVLMLDEPSLGLAPKLLEGLYDLLAQLREEGTTILLVDQVATMALTVADRAYVLQSGTIAHSGAAAQMRDNPALLRAYLGGHETVT